MKTKVIWFIDGLGPGGAEQLMTTLLNSFDRSCFEMRVCALQVRGSNLITRKLQQTGIPVDYVHIKRLRNPLNIFRILGYLKKHKPDIIHTQLEFSDTLGNTAARLLGIPSVATIHTIENPSVRSKTYWRHQLRWFVLRNFCTQVIAVSEKTRIHYIQQAKLPDDKITTMYNGIDLESFNVRNPLKLTAKRKSLNLPDDAIVICTVAVLREQKGIQFVLTSLPAILEHIPNAFYLVVGDGSYHQALKSISIAQGVEERVVFAGHRTDIPEILAVSNLFVLPTLGDALPTVLMEAMAAKLPIVASEVGGVPEIVNDRMTGLLVPPANASKLAEACLLVLQNKDFAKSLVMNAYEDAKQRFNVQLQARQLSELYLKLRGSQI